MKVTAFTAHFDRPDVWPLCEKYLSGQTRAPDQWLVIDSSINPITPTLPCDYHHRPDLASMPSKVIFAIENDLIKGDVVVWWENDDYYRKDFIEWCEGGLNKYDMVGEGLSVFYNCEQRWFSSCENKLHASLCQTAMNRDLLEESGNIIRSYDNPFWDTRLWSLECNKFLALPKTQAQRRVLGMKGVGDAKGYSAEHRSFYPIGSTVDPSLFHLFNMIGNDALAYAKFKL